MKLPSEPRTEEVRPIELPLKSRSHFAVNIFVGRQTRWEYIGQAYRPWLLSTFSSIPTYVLTE
jgi:hypothetical protein